ncbi:flavodoxin domain-containing protein [Actinotalea sp.]|uniref:flavodoxin domain-containing protein n=1 Tax=Actinotalea sp. TaxID=1872145 RepID=UPI003561AB3C
MRVLVAYASRHGSTEGIARRIADDLCAAGFDAEPRKVGQVSDLRPYGAVVVGSAVYIQHWLRDATSFVMGHHAELAGVPVWLFSSGPLGTEDVDTSGRDVFEATRPKEWDDVAPAVGSRGERVFRGAWDDHLPPVGIAERMLRLMPATRDSMPVGDFRDWDAIDAWASQIAGELRQLESAGT